MVAQTISNKPSLYSHVIIMGGGLAGLTLAIQLRKKHADLAITVIERQPHPVAHASHKVGESTVEIGAHYFSTVLGLKDHLLDKQLKKFGFRFFFSDTRSDIENVTELGASKVMPTGSFQIDRGIFENFLAVHAQSLGVTFLDSAKICQFTLADEANPTSNHHVSIQQKGHDFELSSKWLIDASGRTGLIKRRLDLAQANQHDANAIWFRIGAKIDVNDWSNNESWLDRCTPRNRWLSTNHLVGKGYWVWLIPLASGSHSVGVVCDAKLHPFQQMNTFDKAMSWISEHQPRLHQELLTKQNLLQDFAFYKNFSYGCKQVFSGDGRWALTGEAGVFLDPFYSPGSDFIAMGNGFITELISLDLAGKHTAAYAGIYEKIYLKFYENMLPIYEGQYKLFADPCILPIKLLWDYAFYWGVMCQLYCQQLLTDLAVMSELTKMLDKAGELNRGMQAMFNQWGDLNPVRNPAHMLDQYKLDWFLELNRGLTDSLDKQSFIERMKSNCDLLDKLAAQTLLYAHKQSPLLDVNVVKALLADSECDPFSNLHLDMLFPDLL